MLCTLLSDCSVYKECYTWTQAGHNCVRMHVCQLPSPHWTPHSVTKHVYKVRAWNGGFSCARHIQRIRNVGSYVLGTILSERSVTIYILNTSVMPLTAVCNVCKHEWHRKAGLHCSAQINTWMDVDCICWCIQCVYVCVFACVSVFSY